MRATERNMVSDIRLDEDCRTIRQLLVRPLEMRGAEGARLRHGGIVGETAKRRSTSNNNTKKSKSLALAGRDAQHDRASSREAMGGGCRARGRGGL